MPSFPDVSGRISYIFDKYYRDAFSRKILQAYRGARSAARGLKLDDNYQWHVDLMKVEDFVTSYFLDVIKYKEYHFNPKPEVGQKPPDVWDVSYLDAVHKKNADPAKDKAINCSKVAAFKTKWWLRYMPISVHVLDGFAVPERDRSNISHVNETFILYYCLDLMGLRSTITTGNWDSMLYHLKYRALDDRSLMLAYSMLYEK